MEAKLKKKIENLLNNYCYCSLFNKPLHSTQLVSRLIIIFSIKTKDAGGLNVNKMCDGYEMPLLTKKILTGRLLRNLLKKTHKQFKKEFLESIEKGFYYKKIQTIEAKIKEELEVAKENNKSLSKRKIELLKEYYKGGQEEKLYCYAKDGFIKEKKDKNWIYLKAPILDIKPVKSTYSDYKNIKDVIKNLAEAKR